MRKEDPLRWERIESRPGPDLPLFDVRLDRVRHPTSGAAFERLVLECPDWVNVVAVTPDGRVVMVEQYRFGIQDLTIETTAGLIDAGEDSLTAAKRELLEETGYGGGEWHYLGAVQPNPAFQNNLCHIWLAKDVAPVEAPSPDAGEALRVHLMSPGDLRAAIAAGGIRHTLALAALSRVFTLWELPNIQDVNRKE